jgi:predicted phosphoribosyltransferase
VFANRQQAGEELARLVAAREPSHPVVAGLPRGGIPVAAVVAAELDCPLDVIGVKKIGVPWHAELAMGAVAEGGVVLRNDEVIRMAGVSQDQFLRATEDAEAKLNESLSLFRGERSPVTVDNSTAIVVDDGVATGYTMLAALQSVRRRRAAMVWCAVQVAPASAMAMLRQDADDVIVVDTPVRFDAVGRWYRDFRQTSNAAVIDLLRANRSR